MGRHSKVQLQVLALYKEFLRVAKDRPGIKERIQFEFRRNAVIPRTDTLRIEHVIRRAHRQLEILNRPTVKGMGTFEKDDPEKRC